MLGSERDCTLAVAVSPLYHRYHNSVQTTPLPAGVVACGGAGGPASELLQHEGCLSMAATDLGACEWFVWDLRRSNLIDRGQLDQVIGEFLSKNPGAEPPTLAEFLVSQGILTDF